MKPTVKIACILSLTMLLGTAVWLLFHRSNVSPTTPSSESSATSHVTGARNGKTQSARPAADESTTSIKNAEVKVDPAVERIAPAVITREMLSYARRVENLRTNHTELSGEEVALLNRYLRTPAASAPDPEGENWLRNVMLDKLTTQPVVPADLPELLIGLYRDRAQDDVLRDYAVQHMALIYGRVDGVAQSALQDTLWQATDETDTSIGGTALLDLLELSQGTNAVDRTRLAGVAFKHAADEGCGELTRITAVQVCGRLKTESAWPVVQQLAQAAPNQVLQNAAIAALADFGTEDAIKILEQLSASPEARQAQAAQAALNRLARAAALSKRAG
jgi:HEAT repeats